MPPRKSKQRRKLPPRPLTQRQLSFCQNIVDGLPQYEAYVRAGYSDTQYARAASTRLAAKVSIKKEIARLRALINTPRFLTRALIRQKRAEIALNEGTKKTDVLAALRDDSRMMGWDAPQVVEIKGSLIDQLRGG